MELVSGFIWLGCWMIYSASPFFPISVLFLSLLLIITLTDLETELIPDSVTFFGMAAGLFISFFYPSLHLTESKWWGLGYSAIGLLAGGVLVFIVAWLGEIVFKKDAMGGGDIKLLAMSGSFLGWQKIILVFFAAPFFALPFALYLKFFAKKETIPYGPFLAAAGALVFFNGEAMWKYLFS